MKKNEIVNEIVKNLRTQDGKRYRKDDVGEIINYFIGTIKMSLRHRDKVIIRDFGTFEVRHKNSKPYVHVKTGERLMSREKDHVAFVQSVTFDVNSLL